jgi:tetratricopeptide (TPR) repeat protein
VKTLLIAAALLLPGLRAAPAFAAKSGGEAAAHFDRGARQYDLAHFEQAIAEFEKAYELAPSAILLYNIAQCHRHLGNKERALFFYRRYLEQAPDTSKRADVERRIAELDRALREEREAAERAAAPAPPPVVARPAADVDEAAPDADGARRKWTVAVYGAPAWIGFAGSDLENSAVLFSARLAADHALPLGARAGELRVGAAATLTVLPYTNDATRARQTSSLWGLLVEARYLHRLRAAPRLRLGGGVGAGVLWWSGLEAGNPFTSSGDAITGPIPMPTFEAAGRLEYDLPHGLYLALAPELVFSKTTASGLTSTVSWLFRFDLAVGAGYAF